MPRLRETGGSQEGLEGHSPGGGDRTGGQQCLGHTHWAGQRRLTVRAALPPRSGLAFPLKWLSSRQGHRWWPADSENELAVGAELLPVQVG